MYRTNSETKGTFSGRMERQNREQEVRLLRKARGHTESIQKVQYSTIRSSKKVKHIKLMGT
jgi:thymidylate synthase